MIRNVSCHLGTAFCGAAFFLALPGHADGFRFSPEMGAEFTGYPSDPSFAGQLDGITGAIFATGELSWRSDDRTFQAVLEPYLRYDLQDDARTYADLRRGYVRYFGDSWDVTVGADRVFWGVVESVNVVDVINQRDARENADLDEKLGQPLLRFAAQTEIGSFDLFYLPYFRERAFPSAKSRNRLALPVDTDATRYERNGAETAGDFALRYSNRFGPVDLGVSYFYGTARQPKLLLNATKDALEPLYQRQQQVGVDLQLTTDAWLWKLEAAAIEIGSDAFVSAVGGVEYTFFDVGGSGRDVGVIGEYIYDDRDQAISPVTPFDSDLFLGTRITWNDVEDTELLAGAIIDTESGAAQFSVEFQRRIGESNLLELEFRAVSAQSDPLLAPIEDDTSFSFRWTRFF